MLSLEIIDSCMTAEIDETCALYDDLVGVFVDEFCNWITDLDGNLIIIKTY